MREVLAVSALVWGASLLLVVLSLPLDSPPLNPSCLERGYAYHRSTGHWPYLGDGRLASVEVAQYCARSERAYDR